MSRTFKDRKPELRFKEYGYDYGRETIYNDDGRILGWKQKPGVKTKKKRNIDNEYHWLWSTPSWWTRLYMNRPKRREGRLWEREVVKMNMDDLEETISPDVSKKPHQYYW